MFGQVALQGAWAHGETLRDAGQGRVARVQGRGEGEAEGVEGVGDGAGGGQDQLGVAAHQVRQHRVGTRERGVGVVGVEGDRVRFGVEFEVGGAEYGDQAGAVGRRGVTEAHAGGHERSAERFARAAQVVGEDVLVDHCGDRRIAGRGAVADGEIAVAGEVEALGGRGDQAVIRLGRTQ